MKLKILVKIVDSVLGSSKDDETPADMYLPSWLRAFGLVLLAAGTAAFIISFIVHKLTFLLLGVGLFIAGVLACLCWKNQKARVLSDQEFEYHALISTDSISHDCEQTHSQQKKKLFFSIASS